MKEAWAITEWGACVAYDFRRLRFIKTRAINLRAQTDHYYDDVKEICDSVGIGIARYQFDEKGILTYEEI